MAYVKFADGIEHHEPTDLNPIFGGPDWLDSDLYSFDAKADGPQRTAVMMGSMLQSLLEDRFQLKTHRETRVVSVLTLTIGKAGPKLTPSPQGSCIPVDSFQPLPKRQPGQHFCGFYSRAPNGGLVTYGETMAGLSEQLSFSLDEVVIDKTGIGGTFDIHLDLHDLSQPSRSAHGSDDLNAAPDPDGSAAAAIEKLGLKLESTKAPREFLVIDHVERPSVN